MHSLTTTLKTTKEIHFTVVKLNGNISQSAAIHHHSAGEGEMKMLLQLQKVNGNSISFFPASSCTFHFFSLKINAGKAADTGNSQ